MSELTLAEDFKKKFQIKDVLRVIRGGQKNVFIVEQDDGNKVAIKTFHGFGDREKQEIETYKKYQNLHGIPKIIKIEEYSGNVVLFEEFIDGKNLKDIASEYKGDSAKIKELLKRVIDILKPIWADGLIHRDLKPDNIIITLEGKPVIIDFGIVKDSNNSTITETGFQPNTWEFTSPEQILAKKEHISYRTDFFSLGVIGYFLYYGKLPFGDSKEEVRQKLSSPDTVLVFEQECELQDFCDESCKINPSERPRNTETLLTFL